MLHGNVGRRRRLFGSASRVKNHKAIYYKTSFERLPHWSFFFLCAARKMEVHGYSFSLRLYCKFPNGSTQKKNLTYVACLRLWIRIIKVLLFSQPNNATETISNVLQKAYKSSHLGLFISMQSDRRSTFCGHAKMSTNICWVNVGRKLIKGFCNFFRLRQTSTFDRRTRRTWT